MPARAVEVAPDVFRLTLETPFRHPVNCYVLRGDPITAIDVGPNDEGSIEQFKALLAQIDLRVDDVALIVLTHHHVDHSGAAAAVQELSGAEVVGHACLATALATDGAWAAEDATYRREIMATNGVDRAIAAKIEERYRGFARYSRSVPVSRVLQDGDVLRMGGRDFEVTLAPGHSPTDTVFVERAARLAFVGDHLLPRISSNPIAHKPIDGPGSPALHFWTLSDYVSSLRKTADADLSLVLPGHGDAIDDHRALIAHRLSRVCDRKGQLWTALATGSKNARELTRDIWPKLASDQMFLAVSEVLGLIGLLIQQERVMPETIDGVMRFARQ